MAQTARSVRQQQRELAADLRGRQYTWAQVAADFCRQYGVNIRAALRMARGWSQREAAERWNQCWPDDPKTFKNFSYWELWPNSTGHAPSLDVLARLAELYECSVADLVQDCADHRHADPVYRQTQQLQTLAEIVDSTAAEPDSNGQGHLSPTRLHELITQVELVDVHELARLTSIWAERLGVPANRRALLLKLSAGLALAAASPLLENDGPSAAVSLGSAGDYSGIWHSRYVYPSTGRSGDFTGEHYVVVHQHDNRIVGQSLPHSTGSQLRLELAIDASVATGTWRETTSPTGYYQGATYHGTLQLVIEPSGQRMQGMWLGFGREFTINSGEWKLARQEPSTAKHAQRAYHLRV